MLGTLLKPYEDEMLSSWFARLAIQNGIDDVKLFLQAYVTPYKKKKFILSSDSCTNQYLRFFCEVTGCSSYEVLANHTEYAAVAPFLSAYRQTQIMLAAFGTPMGSSINRFIRETHTCKECQREKPYVRISHNLPGVRACWKHGCSLDGEPVEPEDIAFARYAHEFLQEKIDCNVKQLSGFVSKYGIKINPFDGFQKGITKLMNVVSVEDLKSGIGENEKVVLVQGYEIIQGNGVITEFKHSCGTRFCMNANGFNLGFQCPKCQKRMTEGERFQNYVDRVGGYELLSPYTGIGNIVCLRHLKCGAVMNIKASRFLEGARCTCNYYHTPDEIQKTISQFGDFKLVKYEKEKVTILHRDCGHTFTLRYKNFLKRPWCKKCKPRFLRTEEALRNEIKAIAPDFEYVGGFTNSVSSFVIRHKCGFEFCRELYEFEKNPTCPQCQKWKTGERRTQFIEYMGQEADKVVTIKEMQEVCCITYGNAKRTLQRMISDGIVERCGRGKFKLKERR